MGARGPQPTPTAILQKRGSLIGKYQRGERVGEPVATVAEPVMPANLGPEGKAEWKRIVPLLLARRTLTEEDRGALGVYCQAWEEFDYNAKLIRKMRAGTHRHTGNLQDHPRRVLHAAAERLLKTIAQFGLSPSTKTRIRAEGKANKEEDSKSRFFPSGPSLREVG